MPVWRSRNIVPAEKVKPVLQATVSLSGRRKWLWPILAVPDRAKISDFLLCSEYIGKREFFGKV